MAKKEKPESGEARILCDFWNGERWVLASEGIIQLDATALSAFKAAGCVDDHPDAVAYAKSLKG